MNLFIAGAPNSAPEEWTDEDNSPTTSITWPDGRKDTLPCTSTERGIIYDDIISVEHSIQVGYVNTASGSGVDSFDLGYIDRDVFVAHTYSELDEQSWYLRGEFREAAQYWIDEVLGLAIPEIPLKPLILCEAYGILKDLEVENEPGFYPANYFATPPSQDLQAWVVSISHSLVPDELATIAKALEDQGYKWPHLVAEGDPDAARAWNERLHSDLL